MAGNCDDDGDDGDDDDDDIYIMMKCLSVCNEKSSLIWLVSMVFQGGFMVFHGFWLVSMFFQGGFIVFHGFWLVSMIF